MRKIPTLFVRDPENRANVTDEVTEGCEWVLAGESASNAWVMKIRRGSTTMGAQ